MAHLPASAPLRTFSITIFGVKVVATLKILKLLDRHLSVSSGFWQQLEHLGENEQTHNDFPVCLSSQTFDDLLKICSFVCSAGNM
jgi:hypothetical protein